MATRDEIEAAILALCEKRGPTKTICPSEAARRIAGDDGPWRDLMDDVRRVGAALADQGRIEALQRGRIIDIRSARGAIRFRMK
ncbi:MAG: DUF3253 domain-containing protein [Pseudomonadota bacterium]